MQETEKMSSQTISSLESKIVRLEEKCTKFMEMHGKAEEKLKLTESMFAENKTKLSKEIAKTKDMQEQILDRDVELNTQRIIIQDLNEKLQTGANELGESKLLVISLNENISKLNNQKALLESKLTTTSDELAEKKRYAESLRQELKAMESNHKQVLLETTKNLTELMRVKVEEECSKLRFELQKDFDYKLQLKLAIIQEMAHQISLRDAEKEMFNVLHPTPLSMNHQQYPGTSMWILLIPFPIVTTRSQVKPWNVAPILIMDSGLVPN